MELIFWLWVRKIIKIGLIGTPRNCPQKSSNVTKNASIDEKRSLFDQPQTTDTRWRHKSKISEKLGRCGRQNMLRPYLKIWEWEWIFGRAVKTLSSLGVRSPCVYSSLATIYERDLLWIGTYLAQQIQVFRLLIFK